METESRKKIHEKLIMEIELRKETMEEELIDK